MIPQEDKLKHFYLWTLFFVISSIVLVIFIDNTYAIIISYIATVLTAAYKEVVIDWRMGRGNPEWLDFWFSILAPSLVIVLIFLMKWQ